MWDDSNRAKWNSAGYRMYPTLKESIEQAKPAVAEKEYESTVFDLFAPKEFFAPVVVSSRSEELRNLIHICETKGLTGQINRLKQQALACDLKERNMTLITLGRVTQRPNSCEVTLNYTAPETGEIYPLTIRQGNSSTNTFSVYKVSDYMGYMPPAVIEKIPEQFIDRSFVFKALYVKDPIIAIPISEKVMIGLFQWDDPIIVPPKA